MAPLLDLPDEVSIVWQTKQLKAAASGAASIRCVRRHPILTSKGRLQCVLIESRSKRIGLNLNFESVCVCVCNQAIGRWLHGGVGVRLNACMCPPVN